MMEKKSTDCSLIPRPSKCVGIAVVTVVCLVTVVFFLPVEDGVFSFYLPSVFASNDISNGSISLLVSNIPAKLEEATFPARVEASFTKHLPSDMITLSRTSSIQSLPLIALDQSLLMCIKDDKACVNLKNRKRFLFGLFRENTLLADHTVNALSSYWNVSIFNEHYVLRTETIEIVLAFIERKPLYWYINGLSALSLSPFAFFPPKNLSLIALTNESVLIVPHPLDDTIRQLDRSRFIECNSSSAKRVRQKYPTYYAKPSIINESIISQMAYFRDLLLEFNIVPFLFGGTLLGWYRECGLIPFTTDLDLCALASEYTGTLETVLKTDQQLKLYWILGKPDDSLEYSVYTHGVKIDLFFLYQTNVNTSWVGGMIVGKKAKLRWTYPQFDRLCTADLKGHLFNVPCNVEDFLKADYGPEWYEPHHDSKFVWYKSHKNIKEVGKWTLKEWPSVYRTFS